MTRTTVWSFCNSWAAHLYACKRTPVSIKTVKSKRLWQKRISWTVLHK